jgi:hypothetical protein
MRRAWPGHAAAERHWANLISGAFPAQPGDGSITWGLHLRALFVAGISRQRAEMAEVTGWTTSISLDDGPGPSALEAWVGLLCV